MYTKIPPSRLLGGFSIPFCELGLRLRLVAFFSFVKPFADIVGDYAAKTERRNERTMSSIAYTPPFLASLEEATDKV